MKKRILLSIVLLLPLFQVLAAAQQREANRQNTTKVLTPNTERGIYEGHKNYGKSIAVFGGSLSVLKESEAAKQIWADQLHSTVTTYGVGGAGFSRLQGHSLQQQVREAGIHDIYVLWASTNDFTNNRAIGSWSDYTAEDNYNEERLDTQCGGINYCIKTLLEKNPLRKSISSLRSDSLRAKRATILSPAKAMQAATTSPNMCRRRRNAAAISVYLSLTSSSSSEPIFTISNFII